MLFILVSFRTFSFSRRNLPFQHIDHGLYSSHLEAIVRFVLSLPCNFLSSLKHWSLVFFDRRRKNLISIGLIRWRPAFFTSGDGVEEIQCTMHDDLGSGPSKQRHQMRCVSEKSYTRQWFPFQEDGQHVHCPWNKTIFALTNDPFYILRTVRKASVDELLSCCLILGPIDSTIFNPRLHSSDTSVCSNGSISITLRE